MLKNYLNDSFQKLIIDSAKKFSKNILFYDINSLDKNIKYEQLINSIANVNFFLKKKKISSQKKILLIADNSNYTALILLSLIVLNRIVIPVNPELKNKEINYIIKDSKPDLILTKKKFIKFIKYKKSFIEEIMINKKSFKTKLNLPKIRKNDIAEIIYTSGSTGRPKGVILTQYNVISQIKSINAHFKFNEKDKFLTMTPIFHNSGQFFSTFVAINNGASNLIANPKIAFINFWYIVSQYSITWTLGMGSHINFLITRKNPYKNYLKGIVIGGMRLEANIQNKFEKKFNTRIIKTYGLTETCSFATCDNPQTKKRFYGSSGIPININKVKIFNRNNKECKTNHIGEIRIKGKNIFLKYLNKHTLTNSKFSNGWFCTGDLGYIDKRNNVYIEDRIDNMLIISGENVYPSEIERWVTKIKDISEGYVLGKKDKIKGHKLCLVYKTSKLVNKNTKNKWVKILSSYLPNFKIPENFVNIKELGLRDFPRLANGKINKKNLSNIVK